MINFWHGRRCFAKYKILIEHHADMGQYSNSFCECRNFKDGFPEGRGEIASRNGKFMAEV